MLNEQCDSSSTSISLTFYSLVHAHVFVSASIFTYFFCIRLSSFRRESIYIRDFVKKFSHLFIVYLGRIFLHSGKWWYRVRFNIFTCLFKTIDFLFNGIKVKKVMVFTQYIFRFIINLFNEFVISWVCYVSNFTKFYNIVSYNLMFTNKNVWGKDSSIV